MSGFSRKDAYNAGHNQGRTFDDGQGAKLLRPENRCPFVDTGDKEFKVKLRDALIFAGIMQAGEDAESNVDLETVNTPLEEEEKK
jgi:hypothetical protein